MYLSLCILNLCQFNTFGVNFTHLVLILHLSIFPFCVHLALFCQSCTFFKFWKFCTVCINGNTFCVNPTIFANHAFFVYLTPFVSILHLFMSILLFSSILHFCQSYTFYVNHALFVSILHYLSQSCTLFPISHTSCQSNTFEFNPTLFVNCAPFKKSYTFCFNLAHLVPILPFLSILRLFCESCPFFNIANLTPFISILNTLRQ